MDGKKTGAFLRELRSGHGVTQEQLAEAMGVTNRSVSRWETGRNLPDIDILIELADYYGVEVRELLDGERKTDNTDEHKKGTPREGEADIMDRQEKETLLKTAEYVEDDKLKLIRKLHRIFIMGGAAFAVYTALGIAGVSASGVGADISDFSLGIAFGAILVGLIFTSRNIEKIQAFKARLFGKR